MVSLSRCKRTKSLKAIVVRLEEQTQELIDFYEPQLEQGKKDIAQLRAMEDDLQDFRDNEHTHIEDLRIQQLAVDN